MLLIQFLADMASDLASFLWSSYQCHALGRKPGLLTPHKEYLALGSVKEKRYEAYPAFYR